MSMRMIVCVAAIALCAGAATAQTTYTPPSVQNGQVVNAGPPPAPSSTIPTSVHVTPNTSVGVGAVPDANAPGAQTSAGQTTGATGGVTIQTTVP